MNAIVDEKKVPEKLLGKLNETSVNSSNKLLNENLNKDGYLFLKNVVSPKEVELARNEVFKKLYEINEIKGDFFTYEEGKHRLIGEKSKVIYQLGAVLEIVVKKADIIKKQLDFVLSNSTE